MNKLDHHESHAGDSARLSWPPSGGQHHHNGKEHDMKPGGMSRTQRRAGSKALTCFDCTRAVKSGNARNVGQFRGKGKARLNAHIERVHRHPRIARTAKPLELAA